MNMHRDQPKHFMSALVSEDTDDFKVNESKMDKIDLNDLSQWSEWPTRLLGLAQWSVPQRTTDKIEQEYNNDKYAKCLDYFLETGEHATAEDIKQFEFGIPGSRSVCISLGNNLYETSLAEARCQYYHLLRDAVSASVEKCNTVVELGAGYGYNLWWLRQQFDGKSFLGGEYSTTAVHLASRLYRDDSTIEVRKFNFYDQQTYDLLESAKPPVLVFTSHAIEQLPCSSSVFDSLRNFRKQIRVIFHFEPTYELYDETLLGLMRRRYAELNDYNRDVLSALQHREYVHILSKQANIFGINPFNPSSIIRWEFVP